MELIVIESQKLEDGENEGAKGRNPGLELNYLLDTQGKMLSL